MSTPGALLASYPRQRIPLPARQRALYEAEYKSNREGVRFTEGLAKRVEGWMHRKVAAGGRPDETLLELGAGTLNHLRFEPPGIVYDAVEPMRFLYDQSERRRHFRQIYATLSEVPEGRSYDRIVSVAVLEHMTDLPTELALSCLHLKPGGEFRAGIPSEGGLLWWIGWRCTTGASYWFHTGLDYGVLVRHEHVNNAHEIIALVRHFFAEVSVTRFPTPWHHASLYANVLAREPRLDVARAHLALKIVIERLTT